MDKVSIEVKEGSITGLIGPNGSGKTTLFNVISGVYKPDGGEVYFRGKRIDGLKPHQIYKMGLVRTFQIPRPFWGLTTYENILASGRDNPGENPLKALIRRIWVRKEEELSKKSIEVMRVLDMIKFARLRPAELSAGELKILEIARGLVSDPVLLMLDEPVAGVEPSFAHEIFRNIVRLRDEYGITFFIIEHKIDILFNYVEEVYVMDRGKIIARGDPLTVSKDPNVIEAYIGGGRK
ncbi:MAG: ABC transporter ATP-binding protein [Sulfolobales archaeon]